MSTGAEKGTKDKRDELVAHKRALGSIMSEMEKDEELLQTKWGELREAIERLNERYISACQRREAIVAAGGEDPGLPASPAARIGVLEVPVLREYPPRKRISLCRTPE